MTVWSRSNFRPLVCKRIPDGSSCHCPTVGGAEVVPAPHRHCDLVVRNPRTVPWEEAPVDSWSAAPRRSRGTADPESYSGSQRKEPARSGLLYGGSPKATGLRTLRDGASGNEIGSVPLGSCMAESADEVPGIESSKSEIPLGTLWPRRNKRGDTTCQVHGGLCLCRGVLPSP